MADFHRPAQPCCPDQPRFRQQLPLRHVAVVKGLLAGLQVAADQQVMARRGGRDPGPGVPALAPGTLACGPDLPPALVPQQPLHRLRTGHLRARREDEREVRGDPQHVGLSVLLEELPQPRAAAVDLVPAGEIEGQPAGVAVRADARGQLPLGAEPQVRWQAHDQRRHRVFDMLAGDPLPRADQRVPGLLPHQRYVHRVNPVRYPAGAAHVMALHARRRRARLLLPGLVDRRDHPAPAPPAPPRRSLQPGRREPADLAHRRRRVPRRPVQQPLHPVR